MGAAFKSRATVTGRATTTGGVTATGGRSRIWHTLYAYQTSLPLVSNLNLVRASFAAPFGLCLSKKIVRQPPLSFQFV